MPGSVDTRCPPVASPAAPARGQKPAASSPSWKPSATRSAVSQLPDHPPKNPALLTRCFNLPVALCLKPEARRHCDWCLGSPPLWDLAIEAKMLRLFADNGKLNDNMLMHILSPARHIEVP
jgi:hypothetical protein